MPTFHYRALNAEGHTVAGRVEADTVHDALAQLETERLTVQSIGVTPPQSPPGATAPSRADAPETDASRREEQAGGVERAALRSHLTAVLDEARAITPALRAYAEEMATGRRRNELRTVCRVLDGGDADEAARALESLPEYWIPLLSSATMSRDPGRVLQEFLAESHQADELRRQRWVTLAYPLAIAAIAAVVLTAISFLIIPTFADIFTDFPLALPNLTLAILVLAKWIRTGGPVAVVVVLTVVALFMALGGRRWLASTVGTRFGWPFGRSTAIARLAHFTADLLEAGLETPSALRVAGFATRKRRLRRAAWRLADDLEQGTTTVGRAHRPLTSAVLYALCADIPAAPRIHLLREVGQCHAGRARARLSWTFGIIEPAAIVVVGLTVATVVLALFLPLVRLVEGLSG